MSFLFLFFPLLCHLPLPTGSSRSMAFSFPSISLSSTSSCRPKMVSFLQIHLNLLFGTASYWRSRLHYTPWISLHYIRSSLQSKDCLKRSLYNESRVRRWSRDGTYCTKLKEQWSFVPLFHLLALPREAIITSRGKVNEGANIGNRILYFSLISITSYV